MTYDDELEHVFFPITEADRPPPTGPPPSQEIVDAVWALVSENPRRLGEWARCYDELRSQGIPATRDQIRLAFLV